MKNDLIAVQPSLRDSRYWPDDPALKCRAIVEGSFGTRPALLLVKSIGEEQSRGHEPEDNLRKQPFRGSLKCWTYYIVHAEKNHFALNFDNKTLTIHINGKLVAAYPKRDLAHNVLDVFFTRMQLLFRHPYDGKESFEDMIVGFQIPSHGPCTICGRNANLLGGLCYECSQKST